MNTSPETIEAPAGPARPEDPPACWAWVLPRDPGCAKYARSVVADAFGTLHVPRDLIGDAQLMVSELATNAHQHAGEHGPHELWIYPGNPPGPGSDPATAELRCAIFDGLAGARLPGYSWTSGDCGRGLNIVNELSGGRWGTRHDRACLGLRSPGKVVWFAIDAPPDIADHTFRTHRPGC